MTIAVVDLSAIRSSHVPSAGHCLRRANTFGRPVVSKRSGMLRRAPATKPSALPLRSESWACPSRNAARTSIAAPRVDMSYGLTGDSIEIQGGHLTIDADTGDGETHAPIAVATASANVESSVRRNIDPPTG